MSKLSPRITNTIAKYQFKLEIIILVIFVVGLLLKVTTGLGSSLIIVSLSTMAFLYWMLANKHNPEHSKKLQVFLERITLSTCSIAITGILFSVMKWQGSSTFLSLGFFTLLLAVTGTVIYNLRQKVSFSFLDAYFIRIGAILLFCGALMIMGNSLT